jgi:hypothetical protein
MKACGQCQQQNQDDANFCYQCGSDLDASAATSAASAGILSRSGTELWRDFIGPNADRYLQHFEKFGRPEAPRFALTWNWPAFLYVSFLWFLYRKMYLYAAVYAIGPMLSTYLTGDMTSGIVWSVVAGATANYVYYWHCREHIAAIKQQAWNDPARQQATVKEEGGVQPYVIWVGIVFYLLFSLTMFKMLQEGALDTDNVPKKPDAPAGKTGGFNAAAAMSTRPETTRSPARTPLRLNLPTPVSAPFAYRYAASSSATSS